MDVVRSTGGNNAKRNLVVNTYGACCGEGTWNNHLKDPLNYMKLPNDAAGTGHIIFQVHSYPNISNWTAAKSNIDDMISALNTYLVSKGAPVIIGEWGSSDSDADYLSNKEQFMQFADYIVKKMKENGIGSFYWMGLSNGSFRSLPAFSQPDLAECIVKAWRGSSYVGKYPTIDDYDIAYNVIFTGEWQELNLTSSTVYLSDFKGIRVEMAETPYTNTLQIKCYGESSGQEQYYALTSESPNTTMFFNSSSLGQKVQRITLQTMVGTQTVTLKRAFLIRNDNTEEELSSFSPYWGCSVEMTGVPTVIVGDVNNDGAVTILDVTILINVLLGEDNIEYNIEASDVNRDGNVSLVDLTELINIILEQNQNN